MDPIGRRIIFYLPSLLFMPVAIIFGILIFGPFALGEIAHRKLKLRYRHAAVGLVLVLLVASMQSAVAFELTKPVPDIWYSEGLGRALMAGNAFSIKNNEYMSQAEMDYYRYWSDAAKECSMATEDVLSLQILAEIDEDQVSETAQISAERTRFWLSELEKSPPPPSFGDMAVYTMELLSTLEDEFDRLGQSTLTKEGLRETLVALWHDVQIYSLELEAEVNRAFALIAESD